MSQLSLQNHLFCNNKQLTKRIFAELDIPHPKSLVFRDLHRDQERIRLFWQAGVTYVCKPLNGTEGEGVGMYIKSMDDLDKYWQQWSRIDDCFLLEEQIEGQDVRMQVVGGRLLAACIREPAFVVGDGDSSIDELISARRKIMQKQNPANRLDVDAITLRLLQKQNLHLQAVPELQHKVQLKYVANMSQGAIATDVTEEIAPVFHEWINRFSQKTGMRLFAFDALAMDHRSGQPGTAFALEINPLPEWMHHTFSEKRQHDVAGAILRNLFGIQ
ncbi:MAG: hypothetical protein DWQ10_07300 [Calditrichaeota bacterium]|nr:MAG: hypothetical protein DWQ10_07300 [Calditrichota bacterium]